MSSAYRPTVAEEIKNAAAKEIYSRCFDSIVARINQLMLSSSKTSAAAPSLSLSSPSSSRIGVLDIFGFEIFQRNSFEQLCINLANEALQQHFNVNIFQIELQTYQMEDVPVPALTFVDNQVHRFFGCSALTDRCRCRYDCSSCTAGRAGPDLQAAQGPDLHLGRGGRGAQGVLGRLPQEVLQATRRPPALQGRQGHLCQDHRRRGQGRRAGAQQPVRVRHRPLRRCSHCCCCCFL